MTEKETGNAQPGACVDVLPRCWLAWLHIFLWRQGLGTRRWFSKVNMAAAGKRAGRTNVFWSKDRILSVTCSTNLLIPDYVANIIADSFW